MKIRRTLIAGSVLALLLTIAPSIRAANTDTKTNTVTFKAISGLQLSVDATTDFGSFDFTAPKAATANASVKTSDPLGYTLTVQGPTTGKFTDVASGNPSTVSMSDLTVSTSGGGTATNAPAFTLDTATAAKTLRTTSSLPTAGLDSFIINYSIQLLATDPASNGGVSYSAILTYTATGN